MNYGNSQNISPYRPLNPKIVLKFNEQPRQMIVARHPLHQVSQGPAKRIHLGWALVLENQVEESILINIDQYNYKCYYNTTTLYEATRIMKLLVSSYLYQNTRIRKLLVARYVYRATCIDYQTTCLDYKATFIKLQVSNNLYQLLSSY